MGNKCRVFASHLGTLPHIARVICSLAALKSAQVHSTSLCWCWQNGYKRKCVIHRWNIHWLRTSGECEKEKEWWIEEKWRQCQMCSYNTVIDVNRMADWLQADWESESLWNQEGKFTTFSGHLLFRWKLWESPVYYECVSIVCRCGWVGCVLGPIYSWIE